MTFLSSRQAQQILDQLRTDSKAAVSLDLDLTCETVVGSDLSVLFPDGQRLGIKQIESIAGDPNVVYVLDSNHAKKVLRFSESTGKLYKLRPTDSWPALEISGILMHRIKGTDPKRDSEQKIRLLSPIRGDVLDTCCGLGYTAMIAAATADAVTTVEVDGNVLDLARINPYSQRLFQDPKIRLVQGDVTDTVQQFPAHSFNVIIHDPPTLSLAGDLYSGSFYGELNRVMRSGGKLFHYTGAPGSRHRNVDLGSRVADRLRSAGFVHVRKDTPTLSVVAAKPGKR